jgi:hypothetical protein
MHFSILHYNLLFFKQQVYRRAHSSIAGLGTILQAKRSWARDPMRSMNFFNLRNPSNRTRTWGLLSL